MYWVGSAMVRESEERKIRGRELIWKREYEGELVYAMRGRVCVGELLEHVKESPFRHVLVRHSCVVNYKDVVFADGWLDVMMK